MPGLLMFSLKMLNIVSILLFLICCYYNMNVSSDTSPGALSLLPDKKQQNSDEDVTIEEDSDEQKLDIFSATNEWQKVKKGQSVPPGLHIRMNMQTGVKEARLMAEKENLRYWKEGKRHGMLNTKKKTFSREELKHALKHFKLLNTEFESADKVRSEVKKTFKSYSELKKDYEKMNIRIKTDAEIVTGLFERLIRENIDDGEILHILSELEFYVHQIDNALLFCDLGGMPLSIKLLNNTNEKVRQKTAFMLGSALQSNPEVQIIAADAGALQQLIRMLSIEKTLTVQKKVLFALSALIRHFPYAQKRFLSLGGLSIFAELFLERRAEKLQIKVVTLLSDLIAEKNLVLLHANKEDSLQMEKLNQYHEVQLLEALQKQGWCEKIVGLLSLPEHDDREKVLSAMTLLNDACYNKFTKAQPVLLRMKAEYQQLSLQENGGRDEYFTSLLHTIISLISMATKDEL